MDPIWIILLGGVAAIIIVIAVAIAVRHHRSHDYADRLDPADTPDTGDTDRRAAEASRFADRSGFTAGGPF